MYRDIEEIPSYSTTYAGGVSAVGESAFVVAVNPRTSPIIAASRFEEGRVVAAGMSEYLDFTGADTVESTLTRNILTWLTEEQSVSYEDALDGKEKVGVVTNLSIEVSDDLPLELTKVDNWLDVPLDPSTYQVAYVDNFEHPLNGEEVQKLLDYIQSGGAVLFAHKGWVFELYPQQWMEEQTPNPRLYDYGIQRLLNEVGISLMNNIAAAEDETFSPLSYDRANNYHILTLLEQSKDVEEGILPIEQIDIGYPGMSDEEKKQLLATNINGTIVRLSSVSPLLEQIREDANELDVSWPFDKGNRPYSSALLSYQVSQASLDREQTKSQFADHFPGKVPAETPVVENQEVLINFDYNDLSYLRMLYPPGQWHSTGLYVPAGSVITIDVPEGIENLDVQVGAHTDDLMHLSTWERVPVIALRDELQPGTNEIMSPYGGLLYFIPTEAASGLETTVSVSGAVQAPYFVHGETKNDEWNDTIKSYQAPWAEFQGEHMILTLPAEVAKNVDDPEALMTQWDQMIEKYNQLVGVSPDQSLPHLSPDRQHRIVSDIQISAGYMHAGYPIMIPIEGEAEEMVDISKGYLGNWGFWHELGHEYQQSPWTWGDIIEVSVNIHSLHIQDYFGLESRLLTKDNEGKDHYDKAFEFLENDDPNKTYTDNDLFERLVLFAQLQHAYGWDFYTDLHIAYRELEQERLPNTDQEKRDRLVYMVSTISGENLLSFF